VSLFAEVLRAPGAGRPIALATVVPPALGAVGARMAVFADGTAHDTIGGGRIELAVTQAGQAVAAGAPATRVRHHLVRDLAMCCGGWMDVVVAPAAPDRDVLAAVVAAIAERAPVTLTTALATAGWGCGRARRRRRARVVDSAARADRRRAAGHRLRRRPRGRR
jgi:xanthine dehydrogenase accessory factor